MKSKFFKIAAAAILITIIAVPVAAGDGSSRETKVREENESISTSVVSDAAEIEDKIVYEDSLKQEDVSVDSFVPVDETDIQTRTLERDELISKSASLKARIMLETSLLDSIGDPKEVERMEQEIALMKEQVDEIWNTLNEMSEASIKEFNEAKAKERLDESGYINSDNLKP